MTVNRTAIATSVLRISAALNTGVLVADVYQRHYDAAAFQSLTLVVISVVMAFFPKLHARLDAQLREAVAQRDTAEIILKEIQQLAQTGRLRVGVAGEVTAMRTH